MLGQAGLDTLSIVCNSCAEALSLMMREELVLVDDGASGGHRLYWFPCTGIEAAVEAYLQQLQGLSQ